MGVSATVIQVEYHSISIKLFLHIAARTKLGIHPHYEQSGVGLDAELMIKSHDVPLLTMIS